MRRSDDAIPVGINVRRADRLTGVTVQAGSNFHCFPWAIRDKAGSIVFSAVSLGENKRVIVRQGQPSVSVLPSAARQKQERYHSSTSIIEAGGRFIAIGVDHNSQMVAATSTTVAGLASATETFLFGKERRFTYASTAVDSQGKVWLLTRETKPAGGFTGHLARVDPLSLEVEFEDFLIDSRLYPRNIEVLQDGDGNDLIVCCWLVRYGAAWKALGHISILELNHGDRGQWYNVNGQPIGTSDGGASNLDFRWERSSAAKPWNAGGFQIVAPLNQHVRYAPGTYAVRVAEWNANRRRMDVGLLWTQMVGGVNEYAPTDVALTIVQDGDNRISAVSENPFGVNGTNAYRGGALNWWQGDDLITVYLDRENRRRKNFDDATNTNLYYDISGHLIKVFRTVDPLAAKSSADLASRTHLVGVFGRSILGNGTDTSGTILGVYHPQRLGDSSQVAVQVGVNQLSASQEQAVIKVIDVLAQEDQLRNLKRRWVQ